MQEIRLGDCLTVMKEYPDNHFTHVLTDPPYGLKFMQKNWDYDIPKQPVWEELLRICKPGTMMLCFGGPRKYHRLTCEIENAGWEIRDCLMYLYGSGFPKSHNHFGLEGYGTALKPAYEPIIMCQKPLDGTYAQNAEKWGVAGINIEGSRIGIEEIKTNGGNKFSNLYGKYNEAIESMHKGRWPANILFDEEAAQQLDQMSGILKSGSTPTYQNKKSSFCNSKELIPNNPMSSSYGGASRFFYCAKASKSERNKGLEGFELKECEKWPQSGVKKGSSRTPPRQNNHPTVKPLKLIEYLLTLITPPNKGLLLDPFLGSGTTLVAAAHLNIPAIGIEMEQEYCDIAKARILDAQLPLFANQSIIN